MQSKKDSFDLDVLAKALKSPSYSASYSSPCYSPSAYGNSNSEFACYTPSYSRYSPSPSSYSVSNLIWCCKFLTLTKRSIINFVSNKSVQSSSTSRTRVNFSSNENSNLTSLFGRYGNDYERVAREFNKSNSTSTVSDIKHKI